ncbi:MAG: transporter substrate-binding domain-containing protein, partial [Comamonas sp.]|nr:transporter substrate-binding domain-containing protein [Candidatus Comamonas equi]
VRKDLPQLTASVNKALAALKSDGSYQAIVAKWFPNK